MPCSVGGEARICDNFHQCKFLRFDILCPSAAGSTAEVIKMKSVMPHSGLCCSYDHMRQLSSVYFRFETFFHHLHHRRLRLHWQSVPRTAALQR